MKYTVDKHCICCSEFMYSGYYAIDGYNSISTKPIIDIDLSNNNNSFFKYNSVASIDPSLYKSSVIYLYFEFECENVEYMLLSMYCDYSETKIWLNNEYKGYSNQWVKRKIIKIKKDKNVFVAEIRSNDIKDYIRFYLKPLFDNVHEVIKDDYNDIKNGYIIVGDDNSNDRIKFIVCNDNEIKSSKIIDINIITPQIDFKKRKVEYNTVDKIQIEVMKEYELDLTKYKQYCAFKWLFINLDEQKIRIFIDSVERANWTLLNKIKENEHIFTSREIENLVNINDRYSKREDLTSKIKYYFLYNEVVKTFKNQQELSNNNYLVTSGFKEISYLSSLDNKESTFGLYVPLNIKELRKVDIIIILSSNGYKTYIETYYNNFENDYLIVEFSLRGNNYGNYIGEQLFFEIITKLKLMYQDKTIDNIYLFGYSSCASAVISLCGRYPTLIQGGLAIAGKANRWLLENINYNSNVIVLSGNHDIDVNEIYYRNEEILKNKKLNVHNYLLDGYDHSTIAVFMRNKYLINMVLKFKRNPNHVIKYYGLSEYYQYNQNIKVLERYSTEKVYFYEVYHDVDCINIKTSNIKVIEIKPFPYIKTYLINQSKVNIEEKTTFIIHDNKPETINNYERFPLNNGMGILNIYLYPIKFWIFDKSETIDILNGIYRPRNLTRSPNNLIDYPYEIIELKDFTEKLYLFKDQCNVFYNLSEGIEINKFIYPCNDGFEYKEKFYSCKYSIVQIIPNKFNNKFFNVYVNDNDKSQSKKNFFLRNLFIPSETNDENSLYTNMALLYIDNEYYTLRNFEDELIKI